MPAHSRGQGDRRRALAMLALLALALKAMMPAGFMPGTSLAAPIVLCPGQGGMPAMTMAQHGGHGPSKAPHDGADHPCAFAGLGIAALAAPFDGIDLPRAPAGHDPAAGFPGTSAPGRGLAAPPPPSHAPPAIRA